MSNEEREIAITSLMEKLAMMNQEDFNKLKEYAKEHGISL